MIMFYNCTLCRGVGSGGSFHDNVSQLNPMQGCRKRGGSFQDNVSQLNPMQGCWKQGDHSKIMFHN